MRWPAPARRLLGAAFLLPALISSVPAAALAESGADKLPHPKRVPAKAEPRAKARTSAVVRAPADARCPHAGRRAESTGRASRNRSTRLQTAAERSSSTGAVSERRGASACSSSRRGPSIPPAIELADGLLLAAVGPLRVPTRLYVAVPERDATPVEFAWPVEGPVASGFGKRTRGWHAGIDIQADIGTPILAAAGGTVVFSGWAPFYGRVVKIQHLDGFMTIYAHNNENLVEPGDAVAAGAVIATVGRSGRVSGEHVHFEIRRDGMAFNPLYLLEARAVETGDASPVLASTTSDGDDQWTRQQAVRLDGEPEGDDTDREWDGPW